MNTVERLSRMSNSQPTNGESNSRTQSVAQVPWALELASSPTTSDNDITLEYEDWLALEAMSRQSEPELRDGTSEQVLFSLNGFADNI